LIVAISAPGLSFTERISGPAHTEFPDLLGAGAQDRRMLLLSCNSPFPFSARVPTWPRWTPSGSAATP